MGYAGLFTQMAVQISQSNFSLPMQSPYYGPGGIPFSYPPLGFYLLAIFIKLTGNYLIFLRFLPPFLSLLSLIPLFFLALELSKSSIAAAFTVILAATSVDLNVAHAWASGIVRAPAFIFFLLAVYFFTRNRSIPSKVNVLCAGLFFGLTILTHLEYALFCFGWIVYWTIFDWDFIKNIKDSVVSVVIGLLVSLWWILTVIIRYGTGVFFNAFRSHGNGGFSFDPGNPLGVVNLFWMNSAPLREDKIVAAIVVIGILLLLFKKQFAMVFFSIIVVLFLPDNARFVFLMGSLVGGMGFSLAADYLSRLPLKWVKLSPTFVSAFIGLLILFPVWQNGLFTIGRLQRNLFTTTFQLAQKVQQNLPPQKSYLALVRQDEAEWLPFLFQRQPLASQWGSEWLGTYDQQTTLMSRFHNCEMEQDWLCVENLISDQNYPGALVTYVNDKLLNQQLLATNQWSQVYVNERYSFWMKKE